MRQRRNWTAAALLALTGSIAGWSHHALADAGAGPSDAARQEASPHFQRGVELFQEGAFRAALVEFERAYGIAPDYRLLYNIGQVKLQLQDYLGATQSYEQYLAEGGEDIPESRRDDVEEAFQTLSQRVGRVAITTNEKGADLFIDDLRVGSSPMAATVAVNVGRHRVYAKGKDGSTGSTVIDIAGGDLVDVKLELKAPDIAPVVVIEERKPLAPKKQAAIGCWAVGGVGLVGAVVAGLLAKGKVDDRNTALRADLPDQGKLKDLQGSANSYAMGSDILAAVAILGTGAGVMLWLLDDGTDSKEKDVKKDAKAAPTASLQWGIGLGTVTARGHF